MLYPIKKKQGRQKKERKKKEYPREEKENCRS